MNYHYPSPITARSVIHCRPYPRQVINARIPKRRSIVEVTLRQVVRYLALWLVTLLRKWRPVLALTNTRTTLVQWWNLLTALQVDLAQRWIPLRIQHFLLSTCHLLHHFYQWLKFLIVKSPYLLHLLLQHPLLQFNHLPQFFCLLAHSLPQFTYRPL